MKRHWILFFLLSLTVIPETDAQFIASLKSNTDSLGFYLNKLVKTQPISILAIANLENQKKISNGSINKATSLEDYSNLNKNIEKLTSKTLDLESMTNLLTDSTIKSTLLKTIKYRLRQLKEETTRLTKLAKVIKNGEEVQLIPYSFFTYQSEKDLGSRGFDKQKEWDDFRDKYKLNRIDEVVTSSAYSLQIQCSNILSLGLCITTESFDKIKIKSLLKTVLKNQDKFSDEYLGSLDERFKNLIKNQTSKIKFIDFRPLFIKAYRIKVDSLTGCCPDKTKDLNLELQEKLCGISEFDHGLEIILLGEKENKSFNVKTTGYRKKSNSVQGSTLEPRQYVTIYERETNKQETKPIWWLVKKDDDIKKDLTKASKNIDEDRMKFYTSQKYQVVDMESILEIKFDQEALAENINFYGNISLAAKIGNRAIEVTPYSLVGKPQKSYGVNSKPILEIADNFFRLMLEAKSAEVNGTQALNIIETIQKNWETSASNEKNRDRIFKSNYEELKALFKKNEESKMLSVNSKIPASFFLINKNLDSTQDEGVDQAKSKIDVTFNELILTNSNLTQRINDYIGESNKLINSYFIEDDVELSRVKQIFSTLGAQLNDSDRTKLEISIQRKEVQKSEIENLKPKTFQKDSIKIDLERSLKKEIETGAWADLMRHSEKAKKFMEYFRTSSENSESAFLRLIMLTAVDFSESYRTTKEAIDYFNAKGTSPKTDQNFNRYANQLIKALKDISVNTQEFSRILNENGYGNDFKRLNLKYPDGRLSLLENPEDYKRVREKIALFAGQIIFSKLLYGTIDLKNQSVKDGDEIEISVMWYNIDEKTTTVE